ncbi:MAG: DUF3343 domain-containing protein [Clostridiaceae bacterium]|nr:DUF3343 domain-containing protein [Clostridiaceae bacterium]
MDYYIIVYKNTQDAMAAEKILNENNFNFRIMPTPTSITQSCGICTRFEDKVDVDKIVKENLLIYKEIYHRTSNSYEQIV